MKHKEVWLLIFLMGLLLFNYPFMELAKDLLPRYLYTAWAVLILIIGLVVTFRKNGEKE